MGLSVQSCRLALGLPGDLLFGQAQVVVVDAVAFEQGIPGRTFWIFAPVLVPLDLATGWGRQSKVGGGRLGIFRRRLFASRQGRRGL